jgi:hypothetical protein
VEDEGHENMPEIDTGGLVPETTGDEESMPELPPLEDSREGDAVVDKDVVDTNVKVVVTPAVIRVIELITTVEGTVLVVVLPGLEDTFDTEAVKLSLVDCGGTDDALLGSPEDEEGVDVGVTLIMVVETRAIVVVCPPGKVLVRVVNTFEVVGGARLEVGTESDGPITFIDVLVSIVVDPPGIVLVIVIKVLEVESETELDGYPRVERPVVIVTLLVTTVLGPPEMLMVIVVTLLDIIGDTDVGGLIDGD